MRFPNSSKRELSYEATFSRLGPGAKQALNLTGVNGIFWFAWAFGNYQNIYLQQVASPPPSWGC